MLRNKVLNYSGQVGIDHIWDNANEVEQFCVPSFLCLRRLLKFRDNACFAMRQSYLHLNFLPLALVLYWKISISRSTDRYLIVNLKTFC